MDIRDPDFIPYSVRPYFEEGVGPVSFPIIDVAAGRAMPDLLLRSLTLVNVFSGGVMKTNVAVSGGVIAGVGEQYREGREVVDLSGKYLLPGLIDAHIHIESSLLTPPAFAGAVVPHGTTTVIADPHEIVNVAGVEGFRYMVEAARGLPLDIYYMVPSCVPATSMETAGACIGPAEIKALLENYPESPGLAEMMNYPGVISGQPDALAKINAARDAQKMVDGHGPGLGGMDLNAYLAAGVKTDHESVTLAEAGEKLSLGMHILIREGSAAKNMKELLPLVNDRTFPYLSFACDDRHPEDLLEDGEMDNILRRAVSLGLDPVTAVRLATINTARLYGLRNIGAVAPGYLANFVVVGDLNEFRVERVYYQGRMVAKDGVLTVPLPAVREGLHNKIIIPDLRDRFKIDVPAESRVRVIEVYPDQIITGMLVVNGDKATPEEDILKVAVVERHRGTGRVGLGLVKGFGFKKGALASTVAHDSHNLIVVGDGEGDMELAARTVAGEGGGFAVVSEGSVLSKLPLPVAGLMSERGAGDVVSALKEIHAACRHIGCSLPAPFMTMSFLALPVVPALKITDQGLVDVHGFRIVGLIVE